MLDGGDGDVERTIGGVLGGDGVEEGDEVAFKEGALCLCGEGVVDVAEGGHGVGCLCNVDHVENAP